MKRLTAKHCKEGYGYYLRCSETCQATCCEGCDIDGQEIDRLGQIEDILGDNYDLDRLQQLIAADKAGKIAILKYAPGQIVYRTMINPDKKTGHIIIEKCKDEHDSLMLARAADVFESLEGAASSLINLMS